MKPETKLAIRRFTLRWLRKLVDYIDDRLHAAEVKLREKLNLQRSSSGVAKPAVESHVCIPLARAREAAASTAESFKQWEARRSGVAVLSKKQARRQRIRLTASAFDRSFSSR